MVAAKRGWAAKGPKKKVSSCSPAALHYRPNDLNTMPSPRCQAGSMRMTVRGRQATGSPAPCPLPLFQCHWTD